MMNKMWDAGSQDSGSQKERLKGSHGFHQIGCLLSDLLMEFGVEVTIEVGVGEIRVTKAPFGFYLEFKPKGEESETVRAVAERVESYKEMRGGDAK
jgi:hypothetical protein